MTTFNRTLTPATPATPAQPDTNFDIDSVQPVAPVSQAQGAFTQGQAMRDSLAKHKVELGQFKAYDAQLTIPEIVGTRIVKLCYQVNKKTGEKAAENSYLYVPTSHLNERTVTEKIAALAPHVVDWLATLEDASLREQHKAGATQVFTEYLTIEKLIDALEASGTGERLNKEKIGAWFDECMRDGLELLIADKLGLTPDNTSEAALVKLDAIAGAYREKFCSLAGGKTVFKIDDCKALVNVIEKIEAARVSMLGSRFVERLTKMMQPKDEVSLLDL